MSKVSWKYIFVGFQQQFSKVNILLWKKAVLHTTTLTHWHILGDLSGTNQGNSLEMTFVAGATKINIAMLGWFDAGNNLKLSIILSNILEPLTNSGRSLIEIVS